MVIEIVGVDHWEFHDGSDIDISELEMQALAKYKQELLDRLEGDIWGLNEDTAINYAKMHRKTTVMWLCIAMFYNYFFYTVLEWRGWTFFSVVNLAVGFQCAAASHAEFKLKPSDPALKPYCASVVVVGMGLSICNFLIAPADDLIIAWMRTITLSFAWSFWFHFRVHPIDWEGVIEGEKMKEAERIIKAKTAAERSKSSKDESKSSSSASVYLSAMGGTTKSKGAMGFLLSVFFMGRLQHIGESTVSYASVTSDVWAGLDEWRKDSLGESEGKKIDGKLLCIILIAFSALQFCGTLARLIIPHKHRSINFFRCVLGLTALSEVPICILILWESDSDMKWVSVTLSCGSIFVQLVNLSVAMYLEALKRKVLYHEPPVSDIPGTYLKPAEAKKVSPIKEKVVDESDDYHLLFTVDHVGHEGGSPQILQPASTKKQAAMVI
jgi:hypothetical protein